MIDLDELQSVQSRERQTDSLQQLRESFYKDAGEFIQQLNRERDRAAEQADDPWTAPEVGRLTDDIDTAEQTVQAIYERRVGKIVKMASLAAADMPTEDEGLTAEERSLFETLVDAIEGNRARVEAVLDGENPAEAALDSDPAGDVGVDTATEESVGTASAPESVGGDPARSNAAADPPDTDVDASTETQHPGSPDDGPETGGIDAADLMGDGADTSMAEAETDPPGADESAPTPPEAGDSATPPEAEGIPPGASGVDPDATGSAADDASEGPSGESALPDRSEAGGRTPPADPSDANVSPPADGRAETGDDTGDAPGEVGDAAGEAQSVDRSTVRITSDVGEIFGVDQRAYDLSEEDVVTLPEANAGPLVDRDAAERLD